jgi:hypothetical protein
MGLLHALLTAGKRGQDWELKYLAAAAGVPLPPPITLPALPPLVGGCNLAQLATQLGPLVAQALQGQFADPTVRGLMTGDLQAKRGQLLDYLGTLDRQREGLLDGMAAAVIQQNLLGQAQDALGAARAALGGPPGAPLAAEVIGTVAEACPAVGGLLAYGEAALDTASSQLTGAQSFAQGLVAQLASLTSLRGLAEDALVELDAHLTILPTLFHTLGGGP